MWGLTIKTHNDTTYEYNNYIFLEHRKIPKYEKQKNKKKRKKRKEPLLTYEFENLGERVLALIIALFIFFSCLCFCLHLMSLTLEHAKPIFTQL